MLRSVAAGKTGASSSELIYAMPPLIIDWLDQIHRGDESRVKRVRKVFDSATDNRRPNH